MDNCKCDTFFHIGDMTICQNCNQVLTSSKIIQIDYNNEEGFIGTNKLSIMRKDLIKFGVSEDKIKKILDNIKEYYHIYKNTKIIYGFLYYHFISEQKTFDNNYLCKYFKLSKPKAREILIMVSDKYNNINKKIGDKIDNNIIIDTNYYINIFCQKFLLSDNTKKKVYDYVQTNISKNFIPCIRSLKTETAFLIFTFLNKNNIYTESITSFFNLFNIKKDSYYYSLKKKIKIKEK